MIVQAEDVEGNVKEQIEQLKFNRPYMKNKDLGFNRRMAVMCKRFYQLTKHLGRVPSLNQYCRYYCNVNSAKYNGEEVTIKDKNGEWITTTKQIVYDRLYISSTAHYREVQLMVGINERGVKAWYDSDADLAGIDIICEIDGIKCGIASYSMTSEGAKYKRVKNQYHDFEYVDVMIDAPIILGGASTVKLENGIYLYDEAYIDGITEMVKSKIRRYNEEVTEIEKIR